jgi:hypothetical protein
VNEQLQSKLVEILSAIQSATKTGADFALEQLPDIAQQYVIYGRVSLSIFTLIGVALLVAMSRLSLRTAHHIRNDDETGIATGIAAAVCAVAGCITFAANVSAFLMVWFAPKVWLIKELAYLIK